MMLRCWRFLIPAIAPALAGCDSAPRTAPDAFRASGQTIALSGGDGGAGNACVTCHGLNGEGDGRETPRLAGLDAGYLHRQMDDYGNGRREHKQMRAVALRLSADDRAKVSAFYARLPATTLPQRAADDPAAAALYQRDCASCHGRNGEGNGPANPPLAGQPAQYLANQLHAWCDGRRHNDPLGEMLAVSRALPPEMIDRVAAHAAARPAPYPRPTPAASPPARRAYPRNGA